MGWVMLWSGVLAALTAAVMVSEGLPAVETAVFDAVYGLPDSLRVYALVLTQVGSLWFVAMTAALLLIWRARTVAGLVLLRNAAWTYALVAALKLLVDRPRPVLLLDSVAARETVLFGQGFPSGHTALAAVMCFTLWPVLPWWGRVLAVVAAVAVGLTRIYLGVHVPLDVLGGVAVAALVVAAVRVLSWPLKKSHTV